MAGATSSGEGRATAVRRWLERRADSSLGRLALAWFRRYFEASDNSAAAAALYGFLSIIPAALALAAALDSAGGSGNELVARMIERLRLDDPTATLVRNSFGTASDNILAATLAAVITFLIWGLGVGKIFQDVYTRAWRISPGSAADQGRYAIWFLAAVAFVAVPGAAAGKLSTVPLALVLAAWVVGTVAFWLWTPAFLLRRRIGLLALLPGALLAAFVLGGATVTSSLWIGAWVDEYGDWFGSFGVAVGLLAGFFIVAALSMTCAVFAPVWAEWRVQERKRAAPPIGAERA